MTGYYIYVGYNSNHEDIVVWNTLKRITKEICENPSVLVEEVLSLHKIGNEIKMLREFSLSYKDCEDSTITIIEPNPLNPKGNAADLIRCEIVQYASGGGDEREVKELLRRAFCRLVLKEMHKRGMEVNILVV